MKRIITVALLAGLIAGSLAAMPAHAKKKKKAKPVATTLYMHGNLPFGELEFPDTINGVFMPMDKNEPGGGAPKSMGLTNYAGGPNTQCAGNGLFPLWVGDLSGKIVGDIKVTMHTITGPASQVEVRVWPDISALACNDSYPEPAGQVTVDLPAGHGETEAVIEGVKFPAASRLMIQISPVLPGPTQGRILYDSADMATQISFGCIPSSGKSCTP